MQLTCQLINQEENKIPEGHIHLKIVDGVNNHNYNVTARWELEIVDCHMCVCVHSWVVTPQQNQTSNKIKFQASTHVQLQRDQMQHPLINIHCSRMIGVQLLVQLVNWFPQRPLQHIDSTSTSTTPAKTTATATTTGLSSSLWETVALPPEGKNTMC
jgi:hypothetical protein